MSIRNHLLLAAMGPILAFGIASGGWAQSQSPTIDLTNRDLDYCTLAKAFREPCEPQELQTRGLTPAGARVSEQSGPPVAITMEFKLGSAELSPQVREHLSLLARVIKNSNAPKWIIEGHTDARGSDALNLDLSERRAKAAVDYLVAEHEIAAARLEAKGFGKRKFLRPADPYNARNRRVDVVKIGS